MATLQCSDHKFLQFRCFSYLHTRVLLALQRELEVLEAELDRLDEFDASEHGDRAKLRNKRRDDGQATLLSIKSDRFHDQFRKTRPQLLSEVKEKLMEYGS